MIHENSIFIKAKAEYSAKIRKFTNDLLEHLKMNYLLFIEQLLYKREVNNIIPFLHDHDDNNNPVPIYVRYKSLTAVPESLKTTITNDNQQKLTRTQLHELDKYLSNVLYYEQALSEKATFSNSMPKNIYIRSIFNLLSGKKRIKYD